jgi:uncharacterized membrane protein
MLTAAAALGVLALVMPRVTRGILITCFYKFIQDEIKTRPSVTTLSPMMIVSMHFFVLAEAMSVLGGGAPHPLLLQAGWASACVPLLALRWVSHAEMMSLAVCSLCLMLMGMGDAAMVMLPLLYDFRKFTTNNANFSMVMLWVAWVLLERLPDTLFFVDTLQTVAFYMALCAQSRVAWCL